MSSQDIRWTHDGAWIVFPVMQTFSDGMPHESHRAVMPAAIVSVEPDATDPLHQSTITLAGGIVCPVLAPMMDILGAVHASTQVQMESRMQAQMAAAKAAQAGPSVIQPSTVPIILDALSRAAEKATGKD